MDSEEDGRGSGVVSVSAAVDFGGCMASTTRKRAGVAQSGGGCKSTRIRSAHRYTKHDLARRWENKFEADSVLVALCLRT